MYLFLYYLGWISLYHTFLLQFFFSWDPSIMLVMFYFAFWLFKQAVYFASVPLSHLKWVQAEGLLSYPINLALPHPALLCFRFVKQFTLKRVTQTVEVELMWSVIKHFFLVDNLFWALKSQKITENLIFLKSFWYTNSSLNTPYICHWSHKQIAPPQTHIIGWANSVIAVTVFILFTEINLRMAEKIL